MIPYPPGYEPTIGRRTEDEILAELDRRCGYGNGEVRSIDPALASPPPEPTHQAPTRFIHSDHLKRHKR